MSLFRWAKQQAGDHSGFTLMELIVVCGLIGLLLTLAIPTLRNNLMTDELDATARKLIGTVKELRHQAIREHRPYLLHFSVSDNAVWYELDGTRDPFNDEPKNITRLPDEVRLTEVHMQQQDSISSGTATLWISRKGYMDQTAVYLSDEEGRILTLVFSPFSGSAQLHEEHVALQ